MKKLVLMIFLLGLYVGGIYSCSSMVTSMESITNQNGSGVVSFLKQGCEPRRYKSSSSIRARSYGLEEDPLGRLSWVDGKKDKSSSFYYVLLPSSCKSPYKLDTKKEIKKKDFSVKIDKIIPSSKEINWCNQVVDKKEDSDSNNKGCDLFLNNLIKEDKLSDEATSFFRKYKSRWILVLPVLYGSKDNLEWPDPDSISKDKIDLSLEEWYNNLKTKPITKKDNKVGLVFVRVTKINEDGIDIEEKGEEVIFDTKSSN